MELAEALALIDDVLETHCACVEPGVFGHPCRGELLGREMDADPEVDSPEQLAAYRAFWSSPDLVFEEQVRREWEVVRRLDFQALVRSAVLVPDRPLVLLSTV